MNIVFKDNPNKKFSELEIGATFRLNRNSCLYMKIATVICKANNEEYTAIDLKDGRLIFIDEEYAIYPTSGTWTEES